MHAQLSRGCNVRSAAARKCSACMPRLPPRNVRRHAQVDEECVLDMGKEGEQMCAPSGEVLPITSVAGDYCSIDASAKPVINRTVPDMEKEFVECMCSIYTNGKSLLTDEELENLRNELTWSGSKVALLDTSEQQFLEASMAAAKGQATLTIEAYNTLKAELKQKNSIFTAQGPMLVSVSDDTQPNPNKKPFTECVADTARMTALHIPAVLGSVATIFVLDLWSGGLVSQSMIQPVPWGPLMLFGVALPSTYMVSAALTELVFKDYLIIKGDCPNCGAENFTYYGEILTVANGSPVNMIDCHSCKATLTIDETKRVIVVDETPEEKEKKAAAAAAKKAAAAAKRKVLVGAK